MTNNVVDFSQAKVRPKMRSTLLTDGLMVTEQLQGRHLHQAFGTDNLANINIGYAQIFSSTDRYHGKPMVGMNCRPLL